MLLTELMPMFGREPSLSQLLRRLGLEKYAEVFHKNEIDMQLFLTMTDKELKEVGNKMWAFTCEKSIVRFSSRP